jgi:hypothetical protein
METVGKTLGLLKRQAELEAGMRQPGGFRLTEEQELQVVRRRLANFPEAMRAVLQAAHALRRPVTEVTAGDVESWVNASRPASASRLTVGAIVPAKLFLMWNRVRAVLIRSTVTRFGWR